MDRDRTNMNKKFIIFYFLLGLFATVCRAVKIRDLKVPSTYILDVNDNDPAPILFDCPYDIGEDESGLVLKWLLDGKPIYQWIPHKKPYALAPIKNRIDSNFEASPEPIQRYRALKIVRPTWNMSGEYTCSVQTFQSSDKRATKLQIIVPDRDFQLSYKCCEHSHVIIKCTTSGVFPKPKLTIMINNGFPLNEETEGSSQSNDGLYEAIVRVKIPKINLKSPTAINCVLTIPGTNYTRKRETIFYDTIFTTMTPDEEEETSAISRQEAVHGQNGAEALLKTSTSNRLAATLMVLLMLGLTVIMSSVKL